MGGAAFDVAGSYRKVWIVFLLYQPRERLESILPHAGVRIGIFPINVIHCLIDPEPINIPVGAAVCERPRTAAFRMGLSSAPADLFDDFGPV
jgi:hypothetical protein